MDIFWGPISAYPTQAESSSVVPGDKNEDE